MGVGDFGSELIAIVEDYISEVEDSAEEDSRAAAQVALDQLHAGGPYTSRSGKYAAGWAMEPDAEEMQAKAYRVFNRRKPGLTHLLEKGHGGPFPAGAYPHIADAAEAGIAELERRIRG